MSYVLYHTRMKRIYSLYTGFLISIMPTIHLTKLNHIPKPLIFILTGRMLQYQLVKSNYYIEGFIEGFFPRPEACLALMRSNALLYPELVPIVQPHNKKSSQNKWLQSEETLLLFGLLQFGHLPNSSTSFRDGRLVPHILSFYDVDIDIITSNGIYYRQSLKNKYVIT